jgi:hypothetical protein
MSGTEPAFQRRLIIGRGLGWGIIGGTALGAFTWTVLCVETGEWAPMTLIGAPAIVGALLGGCLGLAAGVALALSGSRAVRRMYRAQLISGSVVTAIPLAAVGFGRSRTDLSYFYYLSPIDLAVVSALTAMLLTPRIVTGSPARPDRGRPGNSPGAAGCSGAAR